jgi:diaminopimelate decarboxylase
VPRNQIVPVLYADVFSSTSYVINSLFHRIHSLAALFQRSTLSCGRLLVQLGRTCESRDMFTVQYWLSTDSRLGRTCESRDMFTVQYWLSNGYQIRS